MTRESGAPPGPTIPGTSPPYCTMSIPRISPTPSTVYPRCEPCRPHKPDHEAAAVTYQVGRIAKRTSPRLPNSPQGKNYKTNSVPQIRTPRTAPLNHANCAQFVRDSHAIPHVSMACPPPFPTLPPSSSAPPVPTSTAADTATGTFTTAYPAPTSPSVAPDTSPGPSAAGVAVGHAVRASRTAVGAAAVA